MFNYLEIINDITFDLDEYTSLSLPHAITRTSLNKLIVFIELNYDISSMLCGELWSLYDNLLLLQSLYYVPHKGD